VVQSWTTRSNNDVFSQAAQAVRNPVGIDLLAGLGVERIVAVGASLSAIRLVAYHPDSNDLRRWEVAGTSHVDFRLGAAGDSAADEGFGRPAFNPVLVAGHRR
jgi:hypothetical protein